MSAYNSVNGEWCGQNYVLLTGVLKSSGVSTDSS